MSVAYDSLDYESLAYDLEESFREWYYLEWGLSFENHDKDKMLKEYIEEKCIELGLTDSDIDTVLDLAGF